MIADGMDPRHTQYVAGLAAVSRLLATISPQPFRVAVTCPTYAPDRVEITGNAHKDLDAVRQWHSQLGGELTLKYFANGAPHWMLTTAISGIPVELWTLLDAPESVEADPAGGAL